MSYDYKEVYEENYQKISELDNYIRHERPYYYFHVRRFSEVSREILSSCPKTLLDVGCGDGAYGLYFSYHSIDYVGADIALVNLKRLKNSASKKGLEVSLVLCDARCLPFKNCSFDSVLCSEVIEHVLDLDPVISEIGRVAKCRVVISTPCMGFPFSDRILSYFVKKENARVKRQIDALGVYEGLKRLLDQTSSLHIRIFTPSILRDVLVRNGLEVLRFLGAGFSLPLIRIPFKVLWKLEDGPLKALPLFLMPRIHLGYVFAVVALRKMPATH